MIGYIILVYRERLPNAEHWNAEVFIVWTASTPCNLKSFIDVVAFMSEIPGRRVKQRIEKLNIAHVRRSNKAHCTRPREFHAYVPVTAAVSRYPVVRAQFKECR